METSILGSIENSLGDPRGLWSAKECANQPSTVDKLMNYLISYPCSPPVARKALRLFKGIETTDFSFVSWNEARVASLPDIQEVLQLAGATCDTWDLAITIKDLLQNLFDTLGYCELDEELTDKEINSFLDQIQGKQGNKEKDHVTPFRPPHSSWNRKNARTSGELVLPEPVLMYLKYLLGKTRYAPFDYHSEKVLTRLGLMHVDTDYQSKRNIYNQLIGQDKPISKHRKLVEFSKLVCLERQPRCGSCPVSKDCQHFGAANATSSTVPNPF